MQPEIVLDLSRLVSRLRYSTPTGVDRVEMAYATEMLTLVPERLAFCAVHPSGIYGRLPGDTVRDFLMRTREAWENGNEPLRTGLARTVTVAQDLWRLRPRSVPPARGPRVLVHSSPHHLHKQALMASILQRENARLICLLHDLIPIEYPEYQRPGGARLHLRRVRTVARLADAVVTNSQATRRSFLPHLHAEKRDIPVRVAHLGVDPAPSTTKERTEHIWEDGRPYFICVGTIEPRKNHLLLLNIWRRMAERDGSDQLPRLILVGRRGWENEQVVDMLERCPSLANCVMELNRLPDVAMRNLIKGARALLMPSFAEGYGMPIAEAISLGVPVICSDLPAFREAGGTIPEFLDPLDGPAWIEAVSNYGSDESGRRVAQMDRMNGWRPVDWRNHVGTVLDEAEHLV